MRWLALVCLMSGAVMAQSWRTPTRTPVRTVAPTATATPRPAPPGPTSTPRPVGSPGIRYEVYGAVSLGAARSEAIPSGRYWVRVNGGTPVEMRQPAGPGKPAIPIDGSSVLVTSPSSVEIRLVRADGYAETVTFDLDTNGLIRNQRSTAGFPSSPARAVPAPPPVLSAAK